MDRDQLGEWLSAYLDGELDEHDSSRVEAVLEADAEARDLLENLRAMSSAVGALPREAAPESIAQTLRAHMERSELLDGVQPKAVSHARTASTVTRWATAAVLGFAAIGSMWVIMDRSRQSAPSRSAGPDSITMPSNESVALGSPKERFSAPEPSVTAPAKDALAMGDRVGDFRSRATLPMQSELPLSMERKLARGATLEALQTHRFANESNRLVVRVSSREAQRRMVSQVRTFLASRAVVNLEEQSEGTPPAQFFKTGRAGVNVSSLEHRQVLVRATPAELSELVSQLGDPHDQDVVLVLGGVDFNGVANVQEVFRRTNAPVDTYHFEYDSPGLAARDGAPETHGWSDERKKIDSLGEMMGDLAVVWGGDASAREESKGDRVAGESERLESALKAKREVAAEGESLDVVTDSREVEGEAGSAAESTDVDADVASEEEPKLAARDRTAPVSKTSPQARRRADQGASTDDQEAVGTPVAAAKRSLLDVDRKTELPAPKERARLVDRRLDALRSARVQDKATMRAGLGDKVKAPWIRDHVGGMSTRADVKGLRTNQLITLVIDFVIVPPAKSRSSDTRIGPDLSRPSQPPPKTERGDKPPSR